MARIRTRKQIRFITTPALQTVSNKKLETANNVVAERSHLNMSTVFIVLLPYTMALGAVDTGREKA